MMLDYVVMEIFVLVMVGIIGSAICEKLSHAGESLSADSTVKSRWQNSKRRK